MEGYVKAGRNIIIPGLLGIVLGLGVYYIAFPPSASAAEYNLHQIYCNQFDMGPAYTAQDIGIARRWPEKAEEIGAEWILSPAHGGLPCCVDHTNRTHCNLTLGGAYADDNYKI